MAHPLAIKERLGHSSITVTLDQYGHLLPSLDEALTEGLEETYRAAQSKARGPAGGQQLRPAAGEGGRHRLSPAPFQSGWRDLNPRPSVPQTDALTKLRHSP